MTARSIGLALLLGGVAACSSSSTTDTDAGPTGPATLSLVAPVDGQCVAIGNDVTKHVPLLFALENVVLRPPGACASYPNCGHLELKANDVENNVGAGTVVDLLLGKLANPYHDGTTHAGTGKPDLLALEASLVHDDGSPMLDAEGKPLTLSWAIAIAPACE